MTPRDGLLGERRFVRRAQPDAVRRRLLALRDHLVAPPTSTDQDQPSRPTATAPHGAAPPVIAVVADRRDVATLAAGVALLTAAAYGAPAAVVVLDGVARPVEAADDARRHRSAGALAAPPPALDAPQHRPAAALAAPAARRLCASLVARGLDAHAGGRLVTAHLVSVSDATAVAAAERALAASASAGAVAVVGLSAPRAPGLDALLAACDLGLVLVRPGQENLVDLAVDGLAAAGIPAGGAVARVRPVARLLATRGLAVAPGLRAALAPLLSGVEATPSAVWERRA